MDPTQMNGEQLANALWHGDDPNAAAVWCDDCLAAGQPNPACMNLGMAKADRNLPLSVGMDNLMPILCQLCQQHIARAEAGRPPAFAHEGVRILICAVCGAKERGEDARMSVCARCRSVRYCSAACQRKAWPVHKRFCRAAAA